jgi:YD repeat-containing protein
MKRLIKKILREQFEYKQQLFNLLRSGDSDNIEMVKMVSQGQDINILELLIEYFKQVGPPYFKILNHFDLSDSEIDYILSGIFGKPVEYYEGGNIYDENNKRIYSENSDGVWYKYEYDENGNIIYYENSYGYWTKYEYDDRGNLIYEENSDGDWYRKEYDNHNEIYYEHHDGTWVKYEYDEIGDLIYHETYDGVIRDNR